LSLPTQDHFQLYVYEKGGIALGVLTQLQGPTPQSVGYLSKELDNVSKGWPGCLRALAATRLLIPEAQKLILGQPLTIYTPHDLGGLLTAKGGLWLSNKRLLKYQAQLLECPNVSLWVCSALNPASLLPTEGEPLIHSCEEVLAKCYLARPDLLDQPLPDPDLTLFTDGSSCVREEIRRAGAAVVSLTETLWAELLPPSTSAQLAELIALTKALQYLREKLPTSTQTLSMLSWSCMPCGPLERARFINC
jgi:hypothetical protein